ncbi:hypothetical protein MC885_011918 [Smutsia gigantea]|nr:hypothetical protein MC885_011918 [Smutsia gigantea]
MEWHSWGSLAGERRDRGGRGAGRRSSATPVTSGATRLPFFLSPSPVGEGKVAVAAPCPGGSECARAKMAYIQTRSRGMASRSSDKDRDSVHTASDVPLTPRTDSPDRRCSSSDTSKSTYSLTRRISSLESRRPSSPLIDIKPIEFGILSAKKEPIQPSVLRRTYTPDDYFRKFEPRLYSLDSNSDDVDFLTDEEILSKYQLGMLHFSTQYDLLHNHLAVRVIEARDLPLPISHDGSRQDLAHSNPYVKICLLPDQKNSKQTGVKRKTQRPVFEERYTFEIPFLEAQRRTLLLTVVDFDKFSRHCVIGKVSVPLCEVDLVKGGHWWKALIPSSQGEEEFPEETATGEGGADTQGTALLFLLYVEKEILFLNIKQISPQWRQTESLHNAEARWRSRSAVPKALAGGSNGRTAVV